MKKVLLAAMVLTLSLSAMTSCRDTKDKTEEAKETLNEAGEDLEEAAEDAADALKEAATVVCAVALQLCPVPGRKHRLHHLPPHRGQMPCAAESSTAMTQRPCHWDS